MTKRAAIYCRISDDRAGAGLGVKRQEQDCRAFCEQRGWAVSDVFVDNDLSAYSGKPRPAYRRLLDAIEARDVDALVCWHPDRLHRSPRELEDFISLLEVSNVAVGTVKAGDYDLATPTGRMSARIVGAVARGESEHKSERIRRKHEQLADAGQGKGGGTRPFGFEADRVTVKPDEAELVRKAARRVLAGESVRGVARDWNDSGVKTVTGAKWTPPVLRRLLMSGRIAGLREHHGVVRAKAMWEPIITPEEHTRLKALLTDPSRRTNAGYAGRRYLLTGLLVCGKCGARMVARPKADKRQAYVCANGPGFHGCGGTSILAEPIDHLITEMVLTALESPAMEEALAGSADDDGPIIAELEAAEAKLQDLAEQWARDELTRAEWQAARRVAEQRRNAARAQLTERNRPRAVDGLIGDDLRRRWLTLNVERRQAILRAVLEKVVLGPGRRGYNRFDPARVAPPLGDVVWRF